MRVTLAVATVSATFVAGCSIFEGASDESAESTATKTVVVTTTATQTPTKATSTTSTPTAVTTSNNYTGPAIIIKPQTISLSDLFRNEGWANGSKRTVTGSSEVQGIYATLTSCSSWRAEGEFELRLSGQSGNLEFTAAQALETSAPNGVVQVTIFTDGSERSVQNVRFKDTVDFSESLAGVSVVKVVTKLHKEDSSGDCPDTTLIVSDLHITSG